MQKDVVVQMSDSTEATPIAHLVQLANQFKSQVYFEMDDKKVNAKSIMGMMTIGLVSGEALCITADGEDEDKAVEVIADYIVGK